MKKFNLLYVIVIFSFLLLAQNLLILRAVREMTGDARVVNYSGLVRGATQRLVKLELSRHPNDELITRLQEYLYGLAGYENSFGLVYMDYGPFQDSISDLLVIWDELKLSIYDYRAGETSAAALLEVSERHFAMADEATHNAEYGSEGKLSDTEFLISAGMVAISVILLIAGVSMYLMRRGERNQMQLLHDKNMQLETAIHEANEANRAKSVFLSHMSHDIRTPLNGIIGMADIASRNLNDHTRLKDCLRKIGTASRLLQSLVNNVLDMSKIESGQMHLSSSGIDLGDFLRGLEDIIGPQAKAKNQKLRVSARDTARTRILGDRLRLTQLFVNILSNSVKFTPEGGAISIDVKELPGRGEGVLLEFVCQDTGVGMSEEFLKYIFESFSREQDSRIDKIEGSGLGLTIAKRIVDTMGGDIKIESEKDVGTKVTLTLAFPLSDEPAEPEADEASGPVGGLRLDGIRVLMAEDNELNTEIASEMLSSSGILLDCAENGKLAVEMFSAAPPGTYAIILMDMQMPVMTGCEAAVAIRSLPRPDAATIPIIAMTANAFVEDIRETREAGMNAHVAKPVNFEALKAEMRKLLPPDTAVSFPESLAAHGVDIPSGLKRFAGKRQVYANVLRRFPDDKSFGELTEAVRGGDYAAAARAAHAMRGLASNLSMLGLAETIQKLEQALKREEYEGAAEYLEQAQKQYAELVEAIHASPL